MDCVRIQVAATQASPTLNQPLVSIIIPCYNAEAYVGDAIESALAQTYPNIEVIVIDDGSSDGSLDVIRSFDGLIHWETGPNMGGCLARNRGLSVSTGEWVQFLDADDVLYPNKLARQVPLAISMRNSITYTDHYCRDEQAKESMTLRSHPVSDEDPIIFLLQHQALQTSGPLYYRQWLTDIQGFREGLRASQEFEMNLRLADHLGITGVRFFHLQEPLFEVRRRQNSVSSNPASTFAALANPLQEFVDSLERGSRLNLARRYALAHYAARIGRQCWRGGYIVEAKTFFCMAENLDSKSASLAWGSVANSMRQLFGTSIVEFVGCSKLNFQNTSLCIGNHAKKVDRYKPLCVLQILSLLSSKAKSINKRAGNFTRSLLFYSFNSFVTYLPSYCLRRIYLNRVLGYSVAPSAAIHMGVFVTGDDIRVGENSVINRRCYLDGRGGLWIGKSVSISPECYLLSATHQVADPFFKPEMKCTKIEDYAWIGARALLLPGAKVRQGSVVGAGSVVTKTVPEYSVYAGNPARKIGERTPNLKYRLSYYPWFDTDIG